MNDREHHSYRLRLLSLVERLFRQTFEIREGEDLRVSLMSLHIFLVISSLLIVKPVCNSLFLSEFGASQLPYVFILVAVFAAASFSFYSKLLKQTRLVELIVRTFQIAIASLLIIWSFLYLQFQLGLILYVFYVWVAVFALIATSQFWILANLIFNAREAKRLFGFIGASAIAGGFFGGYLTNFAAPVIGSENLIFVSVAFLVLCIPITRTLWKKNIGKHEEDKIHEQKELAVPYANPLWLMKHSRHLALLASVVGISVVVAKLVEYQWSAIASSEITDEDQLTAFFGFWLSNLNIASFVIQLFVTRRVVGVFSVGTSLFILPVGVLMGAVGILIHPGLLTAVLIKISEGGLKQSINKAGLELLALPIPTEYKKQAKTFVDVFVDSFATGIGGILLVSLTLGLSFSVQQISFVIILFLAGWIFLVTRVRLEYIQSFRARIERSNNYPIKQIPDFRDKSIFGGLIKILEGENETQILQTLRMVQDVQSDRLLPVLRKLIHHPSVSIRLEVLRNIYFYKNVDFTPEVKEQMHENNEEVRTEALRYLFVHSGLGRIELMKTYLHDKDYLIQGAALLCIARESRENQQLKNVFRISEVVQEALRNSRSGTDQNQVEFTKVNCARVIGAANIPELYTYLHILLNDPSPTVVRAAIAGAGDSRAVEFIPILIRMLRKKDDHGYARKALIGFGTEVIDALLSHLNNPNEDRRIRLACLEIISSIGVQKSVDTLIQQLKQDDLAQRYEVLKALGRLRSDFPSLRFDNRAIIGRIYDELKTYTNTLIMFHSQMNASTSSTAIGSDGPASKDIRKGRKLLTRLLEKRLDYDLERIFRLLGLKYPPQDIHNAFLGIHSKRPDLRISAVEFLDNLLEPNMKKVIIPIVETSIVDALIDKEVERFGLKILSEFECLSLILAGDDNRLKTTALFLIGHLKDDQYIPSVGTLVNSADPGVKKMAKFALDRIGILQLALVHEER